MRLSPFNWKEKAILNRLSTLFELARIEDFQAIYKLLEEMIPSYRLFNLEQVGMVAEVADDAYAVGMDKTCIIDGVTSTGNINYKWSNQVYDDSDSKRFCKERNA